MICDSTVCRFSFQPNATVGDFFYFTLLTIWFKVLCLNELLSWIGSNTLLNALKPKQHKFVMMFRSINKCTNTGFRLSNRLGDLLKCFWVLDQSVKFIMSLVKT